MCKFHILASEKTAIEACKQSFIVSYPQYGSGIIELTPYGEYLLTTFGITEGSARRSSEYKAAFNAVTMDMLQAYEKEDRRYTSTHCEMEKVYGLSKYKKDLMDLAPEMYKRNQFTLCKPTKDNVEEDLRNEVRSFNFGKSDSLKVSEKDYMRQHLNRLTEERQHGWNEARDLFDKIEDEREKRENERLFAQYKNAYNQKRDFIEGKEENVKNALLALYSISVPYNMFLSCGYKEAAHLLDVDLIFEEGVHVPVTKAVVLASGKISIKNKLMKEIISDKTNSTLSCVYYMAGRLFNVTPNIQYLRMSVYDKDISNPLLWVEFDRDQFSRIDPKTVGLHADILGYPHVIDFKTKGDALELSIMKETRFASEVKNQITNLNSSRSVLEIVTTEVDNGKIVISFDDAQRLTRIPMMATICKKAVAEAKDNGWDYVKIDKQYKGIIEELKGIDERK